MKKGKQKLTRIVTGLICLAAFSLSGNALKLDFAETPDLPTEQSARVQENTEDNVFLGWDFETDDSKNEEIWGIGENSSLIYEKGMMVFELDNNTENVEFVPGKIPSGEEVNGENGRYLVVRLRNSSECSKMQFWYQTEALSEWDGNTRAFTASIASGCDNFITYTFDLSTWNGWGKSPYKKARLCFVGAKNGRIEIEEIYFTDKRPEGTDEYFLPMSNRFGMSAESDTSITASRTDNWASIIRKNTDGSFTFTGNSWLENYSVWVKPSLPADSSNIKYFVVCCSSDIMLKEFVMLLVDDESGRHQTWSVGSKHYEIKKSGNLAHIIFKLESLGSLQGNIKQLQLFARVLTGTVYDAYWSSTGKTSDTLVDKAAVYIPDDTITEPLGKAELQAVYRLFNGDEKEITFEVSDSNIATVVTDSGKTYLYAKNNGEVTLYAKYGGEIIAEKKISITGQTEGGFALTFDKNTDDEVTNLPETVEAKGFEAFPQVYPRRDKYRFAGWSLTPDGEAAENVYVAKDTTVYALWEKANSFNFNRPNDDEGFVITKGSDVLASDGYLSFSADAGAVIASPGLDIDTAEAKALLVNMRCSLFGSNTALGLTINTDKGTYTFAKPIATDGFAVYDFDLSDVIGIISSFELTLTDAEGAKINIDDVTFTDKRILTYNANTDELVKNMPKNIRNEDEIGDSGLEVSPVTPTRNGYTFLCWSESPESKLPITGKIEASYENPVTLYAVWDKNDHWEFDTYKNSFHPEGISKFSFANGIFKYQMVSGGSVDNLKNLGYSTDTTSKKIEMRLRWKVEDASGLRAITSVWTDKIEKYPSASELSYNLSEYGAAPENFVTVVLDGTSFKYFESNTLQRLRFYPINKPGECEIDYIRFVGSEANVLVNGSLKTGSDDISYIVPEGGVIAPDGVAVWNELHLAGDVNLENGIAIVKDAFEGKDTSSYKVFVLDMEAESVSAADTMLVGDTAVPMIDGATYIMQKNDDVTFERLENTTGINMTVEGSTDVYIGDEKPVYTAVFDTEPDNTKVLWYTDRTDVATVDENGVLTAHKEGTVRLTAISEYDASINASIVLTVKKHAFTLSLEGEKNIVIDGSTKKYTAVFHGDIPQNKSVTFKSDNPEIASIDEKSGVLTIHGEGDIKLTAVSAYNPSVKASITVSIRYLEFTLEIEGPDSITREGRSAKYTCIKNGEHTGKMTFTWSVSDSAVANITDEGQLIPKSDGEVTVRATSDYNPDVFAEKTVTVSGQTGLHLITYHSGTQDTVTGLPEAEYGRYIHKLSDIIPKRDGYLFLGWTESEDSITVVDEIKVTKDTDVYALWGKGIFYEFNGSLDGVTWIMNGAGTLTGDGKLKVDSYGGARMFMESISIDPEYYRNIEIGMSAAARNYVKVYYTTETDNPDGSVTKVGYSENGFADAERLSKSMSHNGSGLDNFFAMTLPMYASCEYPDLSLKNMWFKASADRVTGLWIDIAGNKSETVYVDYIRLPDSSRNVTFDAGTDDTVTGLPENMTVWFGDKITISNTPKREGYKFIGFAKAVNDAENAGKTFIARDDMTLYAVWSKIYTPEENRIEIGEINSENGDSVIVKASSKANVYLSVDGDVLTGKTDSLGYVIFDISEKTDVQNAFVYVESENVVLYEAQVLPKSVAESITDYNIVINPEPSSPKEYDKTVTQIVSDKPRYNEPKDEEEESVPLPDYSGVTEPVLINFDEASHIKVFGAYRFAEFVSMENSVLTFNVNTKSDASVETVPLNLDAKTHPYVIVKIRGRDMSTVPLSLNFLTDSSGTRYAASNSTPNTMTGDWSMLVYDMSKNEKWNGNISSLRFTFDKPCNDTVLMDWILFTDEIPESFEDIEGTPALFNTVNGSGFPFVDVTANDWFYSKVRTIYRLGFVNGIDATHFEPDGTVTVGQAITLAVRIKSLREGREAVYEVYEGEAWYMPYVRKAIEYKLITTDQFTDYDAPISRKACADILFKSLPGKYYKGINYYGSIPDMNPSDTEYSSVLKMYNAGILVGRDDKHEFFPDSFITRAELSTVIVRMVSESDRVRVITEAERERNKLTFTGKDIVEADCYFYCCTPVKPVLEGETAVTKSNTADPIVFLTNLYNFDETSAKKYSRIRIGMKWDTSVVTNPVAYGCSIFFTTENETGYSEDKRIKAVWNGKTDENGVGEFVIDLASNEKASDIRSFRFDPFDANGCEFGIAYIIIE